MIFRNRRHGGQQLVPLLKKYESQKDTIVLGLPRGGVITAEEVALGLKLPLDIISPRKIGAPENPEFAIGAVDETGQAFFNEEAISLLGISESYLKASIEREKTKAEYRLKTYREGRPPLDLKNKTVILVDDGLATGATMKAAVLSAKAKGARVVVVAVPVAPLESIEELKAMADEVVCLSIPRVFFAVGQFYESFDQTEDEEVISILKRSSQEH